MFQPLRQYDDSHIRINLLDIAKEFIKAYDKDRSEYSISYLVDFYSYFNDEHDLRSKPLFISKDGVVIDSNTKVEYYEDIGGETNEQVVTIDCDVFTCDKYLEIIKQRITNGLESIGLEVIDISEIDGITYVSFDYRGDDIKKYKGYLRDLITSRIAQNDTVYAVDKIEVYLLSTIKHLSLEKGRDSFVLDQKDFPRKDLLDTEGVAWNPNITFIAKDCIDIFALYTETSILKLALFLLYLKGDIIDMGFNDTGLPTFKVNLKKLQKEVDNIYYEELEFNAENGVVTVDGKEIGKIKVGTLSFELFNFLYLNIDKVCAFEKMKTELNVGQKGKSPVNYFSGIRTKLDPNVRALVRNSKGGYILYSKQNEGEIREI